MKIISWNVNGVRAAHKKGLLEYIQSTQADIFCIQETKAQQDQLTKEIISPPGYQSWWQSADKKGYSGTAFWAKKQPDNLKISEIADFDAEGRVQIIQYTDLILFNCYFPNSQTEGIRLDYKLSFNKAIKKLADQFVKENKIVIITGDFNVSHKPIDLARPEANEKNPGYLPEERAWMDSFIAGGWTDTFRIFEQGAGHYTWWSFRANARAKNIGWRLDYFCINNQMKKLVQSSLIHPQIIGSDHCPIELNIDY